MTPTWDQKENDQDMIFKKPGLRSNGQRGQGMTEYTLIIVLVAVAALVALKLFGAQIKGLLSKSSRDIAATTGTSAP